MQPFDVSRGVELTVLAGWNQVPADWLRMLTLDPEGCFLAEAEPGGEIFGTTVCCRFGPVGWIALVLVDEQQRGRGIGGSLMRSALQFADQSGVTTLRLDATELGRPLYEKLGFVTQFELARWGGVPKCRTRAPGESSVRRGATLSSDCLALDRRATGTDRAKFLSQLAATYPANVFTTEDTLTGESSTTGLLLMRPGRLAWQIGPCAARTDSALALFAAALAEHPGEPVFADIPVSNISLSRLAEQSGLTVQRRLLRMCRGTGVIEDFNWFQLSSGPELG